MPAPGIIVTAPASGNGKTTVTLGLLRALHDAGVRVAPAKSGPDYIDPAFHGVAAQRESVNLDSWAMRPATLQSAMGQLTANSDIVICEGAMGLFDGAANGAGSTAALAEMTGWPCILVVDVRGQAQSAAAIIEGFRNHRPNVKITGIIFNNIAGDRHRLLVQEAVVAASDAPAILGYIPRDGTLNLPSRHLGLVQAGEHRALEEFLDHAAKTVRNHIDLPALQALATLGQISAESDGTASFYHPIGQRIAIARDNAFAFMYSALLQHWRAAGAEIFFFSPLANEGPARGCDAVYLPGGYPELHAGLLAANERFLLGLRDAASSGAVIYGECGGYMTLGKAIIDADGSAHKMAGLLPVTTSFATPRRHLGYRRVKTIAPSPLGKRGTIFTGHEFHYASSISANAGKSLFHVENANGKTLDESGFINGAVFGSFIHLIDKAT